MEAKPHIDKTLVFTTVHEAEMGKCTNKPVESSNSKPTNNIILNWICSIRKVIPLKFIQVTCNLTPDYMYDESWINQPILRDTISQYIIQRYSNVHFITSCIEHHHNVMTACKDEKKINPGKLAYMKTITTMYKASSKGKFDVLLSELSDKTYSLNQYTTEDILVARYNCYHLLRYLHGESDREEDFKNHINGLQYRSKYDLAEHRRNPTKSYLDYISEEELNLIAHHKEYGTKLSGYPHLHFAIAVSGVANINTLGIDIINYISSLNIYPDPTFTTPKFNKELNSDLKFGGSLGYILKNHSNSYVNQTLKRFSNGNHAIIKSYVNTSYQVDYVNGLREFSIKGNKKYYRPIPMEIIVYNTPNRPEVEYINNTEPQVDPSKSSTNKLFVHIVEYMKAYNYVVLLDSKDIYKKVEGTKMTYEYHASIHDFIDYITSLDTFIGLKNKGEIEKRMHVTSLLVNNRKNIVDFSHKAPIIFPYIELDFRMLEFEDFFFNTLTAEIYLDQDKYYCHYYSPISIKSLKYDLKEFEDHSVWLGIFKNSNIHKAEIYSFLFQLLRPKEFKSLSPIIYGESNAGKTSIILPFQNYYSTALTSTILTNFSEYHVVDLIKDKLLAICEEANIILNKNELRPLLLTLLEGSTMVANQKHGTITNVDQEASICLLLNLLENDTYYTDPAIMNRLFPIGKMKQIQKTQHAYPNIKYEEPFIYLYTGLQYSNLIKNDKSGFFTIHDSMDDTQWNRIEHIKNYYDNQRCNSKINMRVKVNSNKTFIDENQRRADIYNNLAKMARTQLENSYNSLSESYCQGRSYCYSSNS